MDFHPTELFSTYSIVALDPETGAMGGAVQTHQIGVGRIIPMALPGVGVVNTQSLANVSFGPIALSMLQEGVAPQAIIDGLVASDALAHRRQVAVLNASGDVAAFSGEGCIREFGHHVGEGYSVQANMMTKTTVMDAMREAFESATGDLAARMMAAMQAAQAEDGDIRGMQSAALKIVRADRTAPAWASIYDLRVDEHETPLHELDRLVQIRRAQIVDGQGVRLLHEEGMAAALEQWARARKMAPEQEEMAFWQAVALADHNPQEGAIEQAARIFVDAFDRDERRDQWLDLIERIGENGIIEREGAADELLVAIRALQDA